MNNRNYNVNKASNQYSELEEQFNNALIEGMEKIVSRYGNGFTYYNASLGSQYQNGYADSEYWDVVGPYTFQMKQGRKPSEALDAFFNGFTVPDCGSAVSACQLYALQKVLGTAKFDAIFSDPNHPFVLTEGINGYNNGVDNTAAHFLNSEDLSGGDVGELGNRPIEKGQMCQLWNVPYYGMKHPGGFGRLYNVICAGKNEEGKDLFIGFDPIFQNGPLTEEQFVELFTYEYNLDRDDLDWAAIQASGNPAYYQNVKETLTPEEGFRDVIGFMPNMRVTPAYDLIRRYLNMNVANENAFAARRPTPSTHTVSKEAGKPEVVKPKWNYNPAPTRATYVAPKEPTPVAPHYEEASPVTYYAEPSYGRVRSFFSNLVHHREREVQPENNEGFFHRHFSRR